MARCCCGSRIRMVRSRAEGVRAFTRPAKRVRPLAWRPLRCENSGPKAGYACLCPWAARSLPTDDRRGGLSMGKYEAASRKFADTFNKHDLDALAKLYAEDAVAYDPMYPEPLRGREAIRKDAATFFRGFPDIHYE